MRTNRIIKDGTGGYLGSRTDTVKQYKKSENKQKKELKDLKKHKNMLYIIAKSRRSDQNILRRVSTLVSFFSVIIRIPINC